ncbi:hypothetical protein TNCV_909941 [Trichonephila clavipes]|nr:hypothetical protein TNCV_909941 [Trichonephila clavipes]
MRLSYPTEKGDTFPRLERGIVPINIVVSGVSLGFPALGDVIDRETFSRFRRDVDTPIKLQASWTSRGPLHTNTRPMNCYAVSTRLRRSGHHLWMYPLAPWAEPLQDSNSTGLLQDR